MRKKIKIYLPVLLTFLLLFSLFQPTYAAASPQSATVYTGTSITFEDTDDSISDQIPVGFDFSFYENNYSQSYISTNGFLMFHNANDGCCGQTGELPLTSLTNYIAPLYTDMVLENSDVLYTTIGNAPNRKFVVQWTNMTSIDSQNSDIPMGTFQAILYESTNEIQFQYQTLISDYAFGKDALIGLQEGSNYNNYSQDIESITEKQAIHFTPDGSTSYTINSSANYDPIYLTSGLTPDITTLISPSNGSTTTSSPTLTWASAEQATSYRLLIAADPEFSTILENYEINSTSTQLSDEPEGTYYWRVIANNSSGYSISDSSSFLVSSVKPSDNQLSFLNLSGITLDQTVSGDVYAYTATVPNNVSVTTVTYATVDSQATAVLQLNGTPVNNPINLNVGSNAISLIVTAQNGITQNYEVTVIVEAPTPAPKELTSFSINGINGVIDNNLDTVSVTLPYGTTVTALKPVFTLIGSYAVVNLHVQNSSSIVDFTSPVTYTIVAADQTLRNYTVTVSIAEPIPTSSPVVTETPAPTTAPPTAPTTAPPTTSVVAATPTPTPAPTATTTPTATSNVDIFVGKAVNTENTVKSIESKVIEALKNTSVITPVDAKGHWAEKTIDTFIKLGVLQGYGDHTIKPDANITRAEFATILSKVFDIADGTDNPTMGDISTHWAKTAIEKLTAAGVLSGYGDGTFRPDRTISREEMIVIISRIVNLSAVNPITTADGKLTDIGDSYAKDALTEAFNVGLITGKGNNKLEPKAKSTRAEALTLILNALNLNPEIKTLLDELN